LIAYENADIMWRSGVAVDIEATFRIGSTARTYSGNWLITAIDSERIMRSCSLQDVEGPRLRFVVRDSDPAVLEVMDESKPPGG
jgi:hypothetical protein